MNKKKKPAAISKTPAQAPAVKQESFIEQYAWLLLVLILLCALVLRIAALFDLSQTIYVDYMLWDERPYHDLAVQIANGTFASREVYAFAPLFAYLLAGIYGLFSPEIFYIRILNIIFGVLTCWVIYGIGARLGGKKIGLLACLLAALYKTFILYSIVPLKESLTVLLFALTALLLLASIENKKALMSTGLLGLVSGLLFNVRPNAVILVPVLMLLIIWHRRQNGDKVRTVSTHFVLYLLGLWIAIAPFVIRNYVVAGKFAFTTSQSGFNLYLGNNPANPDPYYRPVPFALPSPYEQGIHFTIEAGRRTGKILSATEASDYWTKETIRLALESPGAFAWKIVRKTFAVVNRFEACDHYDIDFISNFARYFKLPFFSFWFIFPLGMAAIVFRLFHDRKTRALGLVLAAYASTLIIFFTNARYRIPMLSILIPYAALACADLPGMLRQRRFRRAAIFSSAVFVLALVEFLPIRGTDDRTAYYNTHAVILNSKGLENEAILYWRQASEMNQSFSAFANLALAGKYAKRGLISEAYGYLDRIPDNSFAAAPKYNIMGDILMRQQKTGEAARAYERSLEINSGQRQALFKLIRIYQKTDPAKAAAWEARFKYVSSLYPARQKTAEAR
ncbi:MAG: hypothetical protein CVU71_07385 [Deltaproteobacteria bacterium HGW-Deltaproteobacteria-6]|jgi:4-amino-4-deoxy-L-arabinose transferase-like glycosyltransferase|nr:MAG: hypothetical protein CVU71_07385 [Deltaproteobacteria bacterium HGW-Deltaproteobacteria-6]